MTLGEPAVSRKGLFKTLWFRLVQRKRWFKLYAKRSLKKACQSALIGFLSGLIIGFQTRQIAAITLAIAVLTALLNFLQEVFA